MFNNMRSRVGLTKQILNNTDVSILQKSNLKTSNTENEDYIIKKKHVTVNLLSYDVCVTSPDK